MIKLKTLKTSVAVLVLTALTVGFPSQMDAYEFRGSFTFYGTTEKVDRDLGDSCITVKTIESIDSLVVKDHMDILAAAWSPGNPQFQEMFSADFANLEQLQQTLTNDVSLNATMRVISVQSTFTLSQCKKSLDAGGYDKISIVTTVAKTQVEIEDDTGRTTLEGLNEYLFEVTEEFR